MRTGHNLVASVFMGCHAMYRARGPEEMRPVGETEFVAGIAAASDSGSYGATRVAAGDRSASADLTLGDRVEPVLGTLIRAGGGRFRGVRHSAAWDASDVIGNSAEPPRPTPLPRRRLARRAGAADPARTLARRLGLHPQLGDIVDLARACPEARIVVGHVGGPLGYGPYTGKRDEVVRWKAG